MARCTEQRDKSLSFTTVLCVQEGVDDIHGIFRSAVPQSVRGVDGDRQLAVCYAEKYQSISPDSTNL